MISIIVPVYNVASFLDQCIQSIVSQSYSDFECILVDDGSTDGSELICDKWKIKDRRIKVIHQTNQGVSSARNRGIKEAKGDYIAFIDSDDWVENRYLESLLLNMDNQECDLSVVGITTNYKDGSIRYSSYQNCSFRLNSLGLHHFLGLERLFLLYPPYAKLYKSSIVKNNKIQFKKDLSFGEDLLFNYAYLDHVRVISTLNLPLYHYRVLAGNNLAAKPRENYFDINYTQWHVLKKFHLDKRLYTSESEDFLYGRLYGIVYDSIFMLRKIQYKWGFFDRRKYIKNILDIPEMYCIAFRKFLCKYPFWIRFSIQYKLYSLLVFIFYIKK